MQYGSTSVVSNDNVAAIRHNETNIDVGLGEIRETTVSVYVRSNYAARYNHAVKNYIYVDQGKSTQKMRNMRGGHFFLYNIVVFFLFCGSCSSLIYMSDNKPYLAIPIVTSIIYLLLTCYNWLVYRTNDSVIHECMIEVAAHYLSGWNNRFFEIPIHARIQNRELLAASDGSTTAILARLQQRYYNLDKIRIMLYSYKYKPYTVFPVATIAHFMLFSATLIMATYVMITR